jgi:hypothetical protein
MSLRRNLQIGFRGTWTTPWPKRKPRPTRIGKAKSEKSDDTQAQQLTKISTAAGLFHAPNGTGYADISVNGHRETWAIRSKTFRQWLAREFYQRDGAVPNATAMQSALALIQAKAHFDGPERQVFVRVGSHDGRQYLDLADAGWNAIEIDEDGWQKQNHHYGFVGRRECWRYRSRSVAARSRNSVRS